MQNEQLTTDEQRLFFKENGYVIIQNLLTPDEVKTYRDLYDKFLSGKINVGKNRSGPGRKPG